MSTLPNDLRFALRMMLKSPGFALAAVLTLALGIGANGAIFNLANAMLLKPLPGKNPEQLARAQRQTAEGRRSRALSYLAYRELAKNPALGEIAALSLVTVAWTQEGTAQELLAESVSENYFQLLGITAAQGRVLSPQQDTPGERTVVVSHAFWQSRLGSPQNAIGQRLVLNGEIFTIVGVAPEGFRGTQAGLVANLWVPLEQSLGWVGTRGWTADPSANRLEVFIRRAPSLTLAQAGAITESISARLAEAHPQIKRGERIIVTPARLLEGQLRGGVTAFLAVLLGIVGLVLLTASANLTNLLLVRMAGRRREMAVRMALGASRARLLQQLLCESLLLAAFAGIAGAIVSGWASDLLVQFNPLPSTIPITFDLQMDARVYAFVGVLAAATGVLLGLLPAWQASRPAVLGALKEEAARSTGVSGSRTRQIFVAGQVALSLVVLVLAALFLRSLQNAARIDLGFEPRRALALDLDVQSKGWTQERANQYYREIERRVAALPGVESVSFMNLAPLDIATRRTPVVIAGHEPADGAAPLEISFNRISPNYFATLRIPLRAGREFNERDDATHLPVVVINETMARTYWPGEDPIGKSFRLVKADAGAIEAMVNSNVVQVVGVAADVKYRTLGEPREPHFYLPHAQSFDTSRSLLVRTAGDPGPMLGVVQRELVTYDAALPGFFGRTLEQHIGLAFLPSRMAGIVSAAFGLLALALSAIGIYGVVAYTVIQRTRELGIRMALGATGGQVLRLMLRQGMRLVALGTVVGVAGALALAQFVAGFLHGVSPADPVSFAVAILLLAAIALASCFVPSRRVLRVDPVEALRHE